MNSWIQDLRESDPNLRTLLDALTIIGALWTLRLAYRLLSSAARGFRSHIWSRLSPVDLKTKFGPWAVITGATDGVGREYARLLANAGLNLIILGRNREKLDSVREELTTGSRSIEVIPIQADFDCDSPEMYQKIREEINPESREIGILINTAGGMYDSPNPFLDQPETKLWQMIRVNMLAVVMMTRIVLPSMVKRKRGLLVNMSSIAGYQPLPLMGLYSASKIFVEWFSRTLDIEYRAHGLEIQTLIPNYIATKMTAWSDLLQRPSLSYPSVATFTRNALASATRTRHTCGYWFHDFQHFWTKLLMPNWLYRTLSWYFLKAIDSSKKSRRGGGEP